MGVFLLTYIKFFVYWKHRQGGKTGRFEMVDMVGKHRWIENGPDEVIPGQDPIVLVLYLKHDLWEEWTEVGPLQRCIVVASETNDEKRVRSDEDLYFKGIALFECDLTGKIMAMPVVGEYIPDTRGGAIDQYFGEK